MNTPEIIYLIIAIISALFGVIMFVRKPQEKSEVNDAVFDERFNSLKEIVVNMRDNHLHTLECKLDKHIEKQIENEKIIAEQFTRLATILEERLPKK